jgi:hypothetical protein
LPEHIVRDFSGQTLVGIAVLHFGIQRLHAQSDTLICNKTQQIKTLVSTLKWDAHTQVGRKVPLCVLLILSFRDPYASIMRS